MNDKMRILHTEWSDGLGGQERRVLSEAAGLRDRGHYVAIACRRHARIRDEALNLGIDVHVLPFKKLYDIGSIMRLAGLLRKKRFDVVNTHSGVDSWIGGIAARLAGVPVLVRTRHLNIPLKRNLLNFIHYLPDVYIACGENMRKNLTENCGFPDKKVISIPTGVGPEFFRVTKNMSLRAKYGLDENSPVITNVGILRSVKGHEVTLQAVKAVAGFYPGAKFLLVGDGPREEELKKMVSDLGISGHVIFTGFVDNIPEIYSISDIAVLSSWSEGFPQSIIQAMAAGVPVVATKVGGVPEAVIHGETGLLVDPGDYDALGVSIIRILNDDKLKNKLVGNALEKVKNLFTAEHMLEMIEELYIDLTESRSGKTRRRLVK